MITVALVLAAICLAFVVWYLLFFVEIFSWVASKKIPWWLGVICAAVWASGGVYVGMQCVERLSH